MRIYITDLEAYNHGFLIGKWIKLPMEAKELESQLQAIYKQGEEATQTSHHEEYFITDWECDYKDIGEYDSLDELNDLAEQMEQLDEETLNKIQALKAYHGESYYNNIEDAVQAVEDSIGMVIEGVSNDRELARKLEYELGYEEELYRILGCTEEAYEQLSSFIHTDDIAHTIDQEFSFTYVNNTAYEIYG